MIRAVLVKRSKKVFVTLESAHFGTNGNLGQTALNHVVQDYGNAQDLVNTDLQGLQDAKEAIKKSQNVLHTPVRF